MDLTGNAARAFKQVESGLWMLYGASYFTDDEWTKIDALIHKGKYVFTDGPAPRNIMDEELISFHESTIDVQNTNIPSETTTSAGGHAEQLAGTSAKSSAGASSNNGSGEDTKFFDISETTTPSGAATPIAEAVQPSIKPLYKLSVLTASATSFEPKNKPAVEPVVPAASVASTPPVTSITKDVPGLTPTAEPLVPLKSETKVLPKEGGLKYYSQEQLDEIKAINATLTKAGEKSKPGKPWSKHSGLQSQDTYRGQAYNEGSVQQDMSETASPFEPNWSLSATEQENQIQSWASEVDAQEEEDRFIEVTSRNTRHKSNFSSGQAINPEFRTVIRRPESRTSNGKYVAPPPLEQRHSGGTTNGFRVAQFPFRATSKIQIDVRAQDKIQVLKYVSGNLYWGENLRTGLKGQFPDSVFVSRPSDSNGNNQQQMIAQQQVLARRTTRAPSMASMGPEGTNAAEWEDESEPKVTPVKSSRYSVLQDEADARPSNQLVTLKMSDLQHVVKQAIANNITTPKQTCWFWKTGKGCRFADHECRDAHYELPNSGIPNYKNGKPTWASKSDLLNPPALALPAPDLNHSSNGHAIKTCWYWKNGGCSNTPEECTYLHEYSPSGVANRPHSLSQRRSPAQILPALSWRSNQLNIDVAEQRVWEVETKTNDLDELDQELTSPVESAFDDWGISTYRAPQGEASIESNGW